MSDAWLEDLSPQEHRAVARLYESPELWPYVLLVSRLGQARALAACAAGEAADDKVRAILAEGRYSPAKLPDPDAIRYAVLGSRIALREEAGDDPAEICERFDITHVQAMRARDIQASFRPRVATLKATKLRDYQNYDARR